MINMLFFKFCLLILPALLNAAALPESELKLTYAYKVPLDFKPAFLSLLPNKAKSQDGKPIFDVGVSSFTGDVDMKDTVYSIDDVQNYQDVTKFSIHQLTDELVWPNEVEQVPEEMFDSRVWSVASAFFLPEKDNGTIALIDMSDKTNPVLVDITPHDGVKKWFYHRVLWRDFNNDGHLDAITARAYGAGDMFEEAQLVWLENPGFKYLTPSWNLHVIHEGAADISFQIHDLPLPDGTLTPVVFNAGFWSEELGLTWSDSNDWTDTASIKHMFVDKSGWYFDLQITDLNMDGKMDVLCTTWSRFTIPGSLMAYEIPEDWQNAPWPKHVLSQDFKQFFLPGFGSPGTSVPFWPTRSMEEGGNKPYIALTGDDDGQAYMFTPDSENKEDWSYTKTTIYSQETGTVGALAIGDVDGDGYTEIFLPSYEEEFIYVLTYARYPKP